jgi:glycosyltransferase involved in cell wall biosynthesis
MPVVKLDGRRSRPPLRILLSAYACEPNRGSEPGIGWQWATRMAKLGHEVHVITRASNREAIASAYAANPIPTLHFTYVDLPKWARFWKRGNRGVHLYYFLWQVRSLSVAREMHARVRFDLVHHITFGVFRQPSLLGLLGVPFIFGPVGGGERAPRSLRRSLPFRPRMSEWVRDVANAYAKFDPLLRLGLRRASRILCKTEETRRSLPDAYRGQGELFLEIGTELDATHTGSQIVGPEPKHPGSLRVLFVGRLVHMKGLHLALPAFARLFETFPGSFFTIVGSGPQEHELRLLAAQLGVYHRVEWLPWMTHDAVMALYPEYDVFLFPSLHDSSGNAVLEAMSCGLPVVCLNLGGPAAIVDSFSGITIEATEPVETMRQLGDALLLLARRPQLQAYLARGAQARASNYFSWRNQVERMNSLYYEVQEAEANEHERTASRQAVKRSIAQEPRRPS